MGWFRRHLTFANVIAMVALFVALGGTGYAALKLPKNSVGARQIKKNAVTAVKVKNGSLLKVDFKAGQIPNGAAGPVGPRGPSGTAAPPASVTAYARIQPNGTILPNIGTSFPPTTRGVDQTNITHPATGVYCIKGLSFQPASATVSSDNAGAATATTNNVVVSAAVERGNTLSGCTTTPQTQVRVVATKIDPAAAAPAMADKGFILWLEEQ
jgi:hypothetical protein